MWPGLEYELVWEPDGIWVGVCGMGVAWVGIWLVWWYGRGLDWHMVGVVVWAWPGLAYDWCVWYGRGLGWHMVGVCGVGVCRVDMVGVFQCAAVALVWLLASTQ